MPNKIHQISILYTREELSGHFYISSFSTALQLWGLLYSNTFVTSGMTAQWVLWESSASAPSPALCGFSCTLEECYLIQ